MKDMQHALVIIAGPDDAKRIERINQEDLNRFSLLSAELEMRLKQLNSISNQSSEVSDKLLLINFCCTVFYLTY